MLCPNSIEQSDPPQIGLCPLGRHCKCSGAIARWLLSSSYEPVQPAVLTWWEEHGDL